MGKLVYEANTLKMISRSVMMPLPLFILCNILTISPAMSETKLGDLLAPTAIVRNTTIYPLAGKDCLACLRKVAPGCRSRYCGRKSGVVCASCLHFQKAKCRSQCGVSSDRDVPIKKILNGKENCQTAYFICQDTSSETSRPKRCKSMCKKPLTLDMSAKHLGLTATSVGFEPEKGSCEAIYVVCTEELYTWEDPGACKSDCKDLFPR